MSFSIFSFYYLFDILWNHNGCLCWSNLKRTNTSLVLFNGRKKNFVLNINLHKTVEQAMQFIVHCQNFGCFASVETIIIHKRFQQKKGIKKNKGRKRASNRTNNVMEVWDCKAYTLNRTCRVVAGVYMKSHTEFRLVLTMLPRWHLTLSYTK